MSMNEFLKQSVKSAFAKMGFEIARSCPSRLEPRTSLGQSYVLLRNLGFQPNTVIDIGVAGGTAELYTKFPEAYFLLVEPVASFEPDLQRITSQYKGSYVIAAAGASHGEVSFFIHDHHLQGSSLYRETTGEDKDGREVSVPMVTVDALVKEKELRGPFLMKVDVQGAELDVLDGSLDCLTETEVVVLEVSMFNFMKKGPQFYDVVSYMYDAGFAAYDILHAWNRPLDGALGQVDIVFVRTSGRFRSNHSYEMQNQAPSLVASC